jgi:hypothetical protein
MEMYITASVPNSSPRRCGSPACTRFANEAEVIGERHAGGQYLLQGEDPLVGLIGIFVAASLGCLDDDDDLIFLKRLEQYCIGKTAGFYVLGHGPSCQKPRSNRIREGLQQQPEIAGAVVALDFDMMEWLLRFLIGGGLVAVFSLLGDVLPPKGFAGLFAAALSVALASLVLTGTYESPAVASASAHSMIAGAIALGGPHRVIR